MADGRMLSKKISLNEAVASLENDTHRLLFTWGLSHLDIEGRISGSPKVFRAIVVPLIEHITSEKVVKFFKDAVDKELITRYQVGKDWFIEYPKFKENQRLRADREAPSKLPSPPKELLQAPGVVREDSGETQEDSGLKFKLSLREDKLREDIASPAPGNGDARPLPLAFSCECFDITSEYLTELTTKFPLLPSEYLTIEFFPRMRDWCLDNRKNSKHLKKFDSRGRLKNPRGCLSSWLKKEDPSRAAGYMDPVPVANAPPDEPADVMLPVRGCSVCAGKGWVLAPPGGPDKYQTCKCLHVVNEVKNEPSQPPQAAASTQ
jgi:hypothetical protein